MSNHVLSIIKLDNTCDPQKNNTKIDVKPIQNQ